MIAEKMYVRCPADKESMTDPRVFVCGQVIKRDEFQKTVSVMIFDPFNYLLFFEDILKGKIELPESVVDHCSMFINSVVVYKKESCKVLSCIKEKDGFFYYYIQNINSKEVLKVCEKDIVASFNNGQVDPALQLRRYEFQNPCWYFGRTIVSRSMNILENSMYGFKELAGSKIYLLPHQINTIMRCLQEDPCRYMLADEVGMGKTIEAISVFKIQIQNKSNVQALIVVPKMLKAQWETELLFKFKISLEPDTNNNSVTLKAIDELTMDDLNHNWGFVIVDEVHRYLVDEFQYKKLHTISINAKNILLLSATPVQQKKDEYLDLLRLLLPQKYDSYTSEEFGELVEKQSRIIQKTALILDDLGDYEEEIEAAKVDETDPHESEDCQDLFEEIHDDLEEICEELADEKLTDLFEKIDINADDLAVYSIKVVISYICSNYQIESNIIRNRRKILESEDSEEKLMASRELEELSYCLDEDKNVYESLTYQGLTDWILMETENENLDVEQEVKPLLSAFFSSPWAFSKQLHDLKISNTDGSISDNAKKWENSEQYNLDHIDEIMNDPDSFADSFSTRLITILNALYDEYYDKKIVLFTNFIETFSAYRSALLKMFKPEEISFYGADMSAEEIEINAFRFQNDQECRIMLCDYTGGEGRNFQCADYILHIDLSWDASSIEQRIGRLDRLERDPSRPIVFSVVVHTEDTFEDALFKFYKDGLHIFNQSLSGMEIIMKDINNEIVTAIREDFKYGLFDRIPKIIELASSMRDAIRKEQNYDAAGFIFRPMYMELKRLINYYAQNENQLFANTMINWATLAGFKGQNCKNETIMYSASSFSPQSAINSQLIPPKWNEYLDEKQNKIVNDVQAAYNRSKSIKSVDRSIRGTFIRKNAIENDYLHFFAPGDEVFDCIVDNAINSCKGQASAFVLPAGINWCGIVFVWSLMPNISYLLDSNVSIYALSPYRNYLMSEQVVVPISIVNEESISDEMVIREFTQIINSGFNKSKIVHLGKRSKSPGLMRTTIPEDLTNVGWFKTTYSTENWQNIVANARKESAEKAHEVFKKRSNVRGAREEMERNLSARVANAEFYGIDDDGIEELRDTQQIILESIRHPKLVLDSATYILMVKTNEESE
ncbi:SNF2-related protein [Anaerocolumna xylanovorans]|uniref:ATP-dependent helicase HepA n=1 Tax=Anaerocolumna xylanovorans DSM 12503 TaxID=1121345 RepID=A0A1M7YL92_9FIRM|nr:SNF2-related protein [Anaerocolumna xylanovorans]SHO53369.1 ATP-dependent helicase HepA [Anaerocolumna xylanovorans DSM 12503]